MLEEIELWAGVFKRFLEIQESPLEDEGDQIIVRAQDDPHCRLVIRNEAECRGFLHRLNALACELGWNITERST